MVTENFFVDLVTKTYLPLIQFRVTGGLETTLAVTGQEA